MAGLPNLRVCAMERRRIKRIKATASVGCIVDGAKRQAFTYDLSAHGCMLQASGEFLSVGDDVGLSFGEDLLVKGKVVWVNHRNAGVQFAAPLSPSATKKILFNVVGAGFQIALRRSRGRLAAAQTAARTSQRWNPRIVQSLQPNIAGGPDGTLRYAPGMEALGLITGFAIPFIGSGIILLTKLAT